MNLKKSKSRATLSTLLLTLVLAACSEKPEAMMISAKDYLAKNDRKAAVIQIKNALQADPQMPEARFLLGTALLDEGDPVGAELELRKAYDLKYPQDLVVPPLARTLLEQGQAKKLTDEFASVELTQPAARANLQMSLTTAYAMLGKNEMAQSALEAALQAEPGHAPALVVQARQKAAQRDFDGALTMLDEIIVKSPTSFEAWKLKGDIFLYGKENIEQALAAYRKTIDIKPDYLIGHTAVVTTLMQQGNSDDAASQIEQIRKFAPNHPQTKFLEAQLAFQKKDFKLSRDLVQQVLKVAPDNLQGLQLAGTVELQLNSLAQAEYYLNRVVQAAPNLPVARRLLVITYLRSGQPGKALASLLPGLNRDNVDPALLSVAGEVYLQSGDIKKAEEYFSKASQQDPDNVKNRTSLALAHLVGGQVESAFGELQNIAKTDPGTTADLALISVHLRRQEFDKALSAIDGLEKKQPNEPLAANLRGRTLIAKQDIAGARKSFERALQIDPGFYPAVASLAALDLADKKPEDAKKRFEAVLAKNPKHPQAHLALAELATRSGATPQEVVKLIGNAVAANPTDVAPRLLLIEFHLRNKDIKQATSAAQNAVATLPNSPEVLDALGRTQQSAGEVNQALTTFNKLAGMQPQLPQPQMRLAGAYLAAKNQEAAAQSFKKALAIKPDLVEAQRALIVLYLVDSKFEEALAMARTMQKQRPREAVGYELEGDIGVTRKKWDDAAAAYRAGLKAVDATSLAAKLHATLQTSGKHAEADKFAAGWQKDHPKDATFLSYLGDRAIASKDYGGAEASYAAVVKLQANNAVAYNNLAWVTSKLNKDGAIGFAEKAIALAPNQPAFMDTLAVLLSEKGDYAKALALQTKVVSIAPDNALFRLNLAKIHVKGGEKALARKELEELAKLGDKFGGQAEVAGLLSGL